MTSFDLVANSFCHEYEWGELTRSERESCAMREFFRKNSPHQEKDISEDLRDEVSLSLEQRVLGKTFRAMASPSVGDSGRGLVVKDNGWGYQSGSGANGQVYSVLAENNNSGRTYIAGAFTNYGGTAINRIARIGAAGELDPSFTVGTGSNGIIQVMGHSHDSSGDFYIGGTFTSYNGTTINRIAKLNSDGTIDTAFNVGTGADNVVQSIKTNPDGNGELAISGTFTTYNGTSINRIARINSDGSLNTNFSVGSGFDSDVHNVEYSTSGDGSLFVAGDFTTYNGTSINRLAKIKSDGTLDTTFNVGTGANNNVRRVLLANDGSGDVYIAGQFTTYNGTSINRIARINSDGSLDTSFNVGTGADNTIYDLIHAPNNDSDVFVSGDFTTYRGTTIGRIVRINSDGTIDGNFNAGTEADGLVRSMDIVPTVSKDIVIGGTFANYDSVTRTRYAQLSNVTGRLRDGKIYVSGTGTAAAGNFAVAAITLAGALDTSFSGDGKATPSTGFGGATEFLAHAITIEDSTGDIVAAGVTKVGDKQYAVAKLNSDGTDDTSFDTNGQTQFDWGSFADAARAVKIDLTGKIQIAGKSLSNDGGLIRWDYSGARLNTDGSLDTSYGGGDGGGIRNNPLTDEVVLAIAIDTNNNTIAAGGCDPSSGSNADFCLMRFDSSGLLDETIGNSGHAGVVIHSISASETDFAWDIAIDHEGRYVLGGTTNNGSNSDFAVIRVKTDGNLDTTFSSDGKHSFAVGTAADIGRGVAVDDLGRIVIGGMMNNGTDNDFAVARLNSDGSLDTSFSTNGLANFDIGTSSDDQGRRIGLIGNRIVISGDSAADFAAILLNTDGSLDTNFSGDGKFTFDF